MIDGEVARGVRGVYAIVCVDGRAYVGGTADVWHRWAVHRSGLKRGKHSNIHLQRAWQDLGPDAFRFILLEEVPAGAEIAPVERKWVDHYEASGSLFNVYLSSKPPGGERRSPELRARMSARTRRMWSDPVLRAKMSGTNAGEKCPHAKLTDDAVREIRRRVAAGTPQKDMAEAFGVHKVTVSQIVARKSWAHVSDVAAGATDAR